MPVAFPKRSAEKLDRRKTTPAGPPTVAELVDQLGGIPLDRILLKPVPGKATEADLLHLLDGEPKHICELINGTLVEKPMGMKESRIASVIIYYLQGYVIEHDLGFVTSPDGPYRILSNNIRMPDVAFIAWSRFPSREAADEYKVSPVSPNLAIEVLSESNTKKEMEKKIEQYLESGVELIWIVDPKKRLVTVHRPGSEPEVFTSKEKLSGEKVLPGFKLEISKFL